MTTASGSSAEIEAYLAAVRASLSDIAEDERADLLAEVEASLVEAAGEGDRPIASLGPPEEFAAELRASAGLGEPTGAPAAPRGATALRALVVELGPEPRARSAVRIGARARAGLVARPRLPARRRHRGRDGSELVDRASVAPAPCRARAGASS